MGKKRNGRASTMAGGLAVGAGVSMVLTFLLSVLVGKLADMEIISETAIGYAAMGILLLSSIAAAVVSIGRIKRQRLIVGLASGGIYYLMLLSITALFFGGRYTGMGVTALVVAAGCGAVILAGMGQGRGRRSHQRKAASR